ncbi:MAG TPA: hypothetical protein VMM16_06175 [Verrucomicrobiae bacterium]|nr:hypothetical protein [Verrucomicrobiae bacterium]
MRDIASLFTATTCTGTVRRCLEYAIALGLALLSSYWIVQGG